jgi:citronellol/citronellal dehydrogenase
MRRVNQIVGHLANGQSKLSASQLEAAKVAAKTSAIYDIISKAKRGTLKGKTLFVTGASRGIGLSIALRAAKDGANVIIAAKTTTPHPRLPGTIHSAAEEIRKAGGKALPIECDIRFEDQVKAAVEAGVKEFGGIDICINNASAISLTGTLDTDMKKYDLMHQINTRGTFLTSKVCIPYLKKSKNPHILNISPPLNMEEKWFAPHVAYTMAKFGMSMCALGMAGELRHDGIAVNTLWPLTTIATAAVQNLLGGDDLVSKSRLPEIMADAAYVVLTSPSKQVSGGFFIDETVLRAVGVSDFSKYAVVPGTADSDLAADFFV